MSESIKVVECVGNVNPVSGHVVSALTIGNEYRVVKEAKALYFIRTSCNGKVVGYPKCYFEFKRYE